MKRAWQLALAVLLLGAFALVAIWFHSSSANQKVRLFSLPRRAGIGRIYNLTPGKLVVTAYPDDESYNVAVFDLQSLRFTDTFNFVPKSADVYSGSSIMALACAKRSPRIAIAYGYAEAVGVGNTSTGELELEVGFDPHGYIASGFVGSHEVAVAFGRFSPVVAVIDLDAPSLLGSIQLPASCLPSAEWEDESTPDYRNCYWKYGQLVFSGPTATAFMPFGHLGIVQWIRLDLTDGFSCEVGAIDVGGNPRWLTLSENELTLYSLDDQNNELKVIDILTLCVMDTISTESGCIVGGIVESGGIVYVLYEFRPKDEFWLGRIDVATHDTASSTAIVGWPNGPLIYNGSPYVIRTEMGSEAADLLEFDARTLALTSELSLGEMAGGFIIDQSTGYGASSTLSPEGGGVGRLLVLGL